jgi:hypothetical protein
LTSGGVRVLDPEDVILYWDACVKKSRIKARLKVLPPAAQVSFAAGALTHALNVVSANAVWSNDSPVVDELRDVLNAVWDQVASSLRPRTLRERAEKLFRFLPDEDTTSTPGLVDLVNGVAELCRLIDRPTALAALDVASFAYQAVASVSLPVSQIAGGEKKHAAAEECSCACTEEIQFHIRYVERLEHMVAPFTYQG